jgi:DNA-binding IscR family transcriptional regulator
VKTILDAVGEPLFPAPCADHGTKACPQEEGCLISPIWQDFYELMRKYLSAISLKDIVENKRIPAGLSVAR